MRAVEEIVRQWQQWQRQQWQQQSREREESVEEEEEEVFYEVEEDEDSYRVEEERGSSLPLPPPLPYYIFSSLDMFAFLRAQLNQYCFLFEHIYAWTGKTHSL